MNKIKILFVIFFIAFTSIASAQVVYFQYGYNGAFTKLDGFNSVIDSYNNTRPWLNEEMDYFNYLDGMNVNIGFSLGGLWLETGFDFRGKKHSVEGTNSFGLTDTYQLKVKNGSFKGTLGIFIYDDLKALALGARVEGGTLTVKSRVFGDTFDKDSFEDVESGYLTSRFGPIIKFFSFNGDNGTHISFSAYYLWSLNEFNHTTLDEKLNDTFYFGDQEQFNLSPSIFGITIELGIAGVNT